MNYIYIYRLVCVKNVHISVIRYDDDDDDDDVVLCLICWNDSVV